MQQLLEDVLGEFQPDVEHIVSESLASGSIITRVPGRLSVCGIVNGNNRRYSRKVWENNLADGSKLKVLISKRAAFGLLEHPKDGKVDLNSPISHVVTDAHFKEGVDEVFGEILIANTPEGNKLKALIEIGYNPTVSSRGYGTLTKASDGVDEVQEDFVCEGWDVVMNPSFIQATLTPQRESIISQPVVEPPKPALSESGTTPVTEKAVGKPAAQVSETMSIKAIRESITTFATVDPAKLAPARFAEGLSRLNDLHQEVAKYQSEDATRSWEAQQLHDEIKLQEGRWSAAAEQPKQTVAKLQENTTKILQVVKAVSATALKFKSQLGESIKKVDTQKSLVEEITKRGKGWKARSDKMEALASSTDRKYKTACEALDIMAARYKADLTAVGTRVLQLEFADRIAEPAIAKALKEAKKPEDLIKIREQLEIKPEGSKAPKVEEDQTEVPPVPQQTEEPSEAKPGETKPKEVEVKPETTEPTVVVPESKPGEPTSVNESVALARRLSGASQR